MMEVASLELCKELYDVSGWDATYCFWTQQGNGNWEVDNGKPIFPAYDAGFLLRKLQSIDDGFRYAVFAQNDFEPVWHANRTSANTVLQDAVAETPEDALAKLCVSLFKAGILQKGEL